jgi:very-short-patch-repair endonuclease
VDRLFGGVTVLPKNKKLTSYSQDLRKNATKEEKHLWFDFLKKYPIQFNRQKVIGSYIVDFYCDKAKLVVEIDGDQHGEENAMTYDNERTLYLNNLGIQVLRFSNAEISKAFEEVCINIHEKIMVLYPSPTVLSYQFSKWEV